MEQLENKRQDGWFKVPKPINNYCIIYKLSKHLSKCLKLKNPKQGKPNSHVQKFHLKNSNTDKQT